LSLAAEIPDDVGVGRAYTNLADWCYTTGRYAPVVDLARDRLDYVVRVGLANLYGQAISANAIAALHRAGRWAEAQQLRDDPRIPHGHAYLELRWLPLLLDTGRMDEARATIRAVLEDTADASRRPVPRVRVAARRPDPCDR
jgi:hypothetical protein